jgi:acyl-homoserine lactone synthase
MVFHLLNNFNEEPTMLHVVTSENRELYADEVEQSFRLRYQVFVKDRKWRNLARPDERDVDQFDDDNATYLLAIEGDERTVVGGSRLVPTTGPYLLPDVFPRLAQQPIPRGPRVFEWGRLYVAPARREGHGMRRTALSRTSCLIMAGVVEYCLDEGIDQLAVVSEMYLLPRFMQLGLHPKPLGLPETIDGVATLAYTLAPSEEALDKIKAIHGFGSTVLERDGITRPAVNMPTVAEHSTRRSA